MRIPVTGHHRIDALTVKTIIVAMQAQAQAAARFAGLRQRVEALHLAAWCRRQRVLLARRAAKVWAGVRVPDTQNRKPAGKDATPYRGFSNPP